MTKILLLSSIVALSFGIVASADNIGKGQKAYLKKLKTKCSMNGAKMAGMHT